MYRVPHSHDPGFRVADRSGVLNRITGRSYLAVARRLFWMRPGGTPVTGLMAARARKARPPPGAYTNRADGCDPPARSATQSTTTNRRRALMCNP